MPRLRHLWVFGLAFVSSFTTPQPLDASPTAADPYHYLYSGEDLGATYHRDSTTIKLWAPTVETVRLCLFADATNQVFTSIPMSRDREGIWSVRLKGDWDGKYYLYDITAAGAAPGAQTHVRVNDPYARGCSANTGRTLIYDPARTNPQGWERDQFVRLGHNVDAILYEVHVRDFSVDPSSGVSPARRGKFLGMVQSGAKTPEGEASLLDHLQELGITHVHLLPVNEYAGGDETEPADKYTWYDWGYDPVLYNTPEGSYASNADGTDRQREFKQMVQEFHQHNLGVVLDVVYNHTARIGSQKLSIFDQIFPGYYYRTDASGRYADATGCGNEFASERPMARKFIVDSITYWMREYHVDGFRFDLMGILDRETMLEIYRAAKRINPSAILYGEGWQMEGLLPPEQMMTQANVRGTGIAAFNDGIRDNIKGDAQNGPPPGFVQGAGPPYGGMERFRLNLKGQSTGRDLKSIEVSSPGETINYDSVHDDHCLWDKLQLSAGDQSEALRIQMDKLAAGIVLTAQGVPFLMAGDEFLRSKNLVKNSYNNDDPRVNPIDWRLKSKNREVFNFYKGMTALRKAHPAFRMQEAATVDRSWEWVENAPKNVVAYVIKNHANGDSWQNILVVLNGTGQAQVLTVPGNWIIVANDQKAGTEPLQSTVNEIRVDPYSLVVAHSRETPP